MATIREYDVAEGVISGKNAAMVAAGVGGIDMAHFSPIPTLSEVRELLGDHIEGLSLITCFNPNRYAKALPKTPPSDTIIKCDYMYSSCVALVSAPALPKKDCKEMFDGCDNLLFPAVIPHEVTNMSDFYWECFSLKYPVSVPENVTNVSDTYKSCTNITGEMILRPQSLASYDFALKDTTKQITIYGDRSVCEAIAATANNGNASWAAWYDPIPAVTDRGQGSYTTADDITRMVRNGALAVSSYAPGRMVYHQGDIVRADEWEALVEAAQTIDPTITLSTNYANLNKIEAAFDSAL